MCSAHCKSYTRVCHHHDCAVIIIHQEVRSLKQLDAVVGQAESSCNSRQVALKP
jgi:hypothetical protein